MADQERLASAARNALLDMAKSLERYCSRPDHNQEFGRLQKEQLSVLIDFFNYQIEQDNQNTGEPAQLSNPVHPLAVNLVETCRIHPPDGDSAFNVLNKRIRSYSRAHFATEFSRASAQALGSQFLPATQRGMLSLVCLQISNEMTDGFIKSVHKCLNL